MFDEAPLCLVGSLAGIRPMLMRHVVFVRVDHATLWGGQTLGAEGDGTLVSWLGDFR